MGSERRASDELRAVKDEPLLPVEKRLVAWSLIVGIVLLGALILVSYTLFPPH